MKTIFIEGIYNHSFSIRCIPRDEAGQHIEDISIKLKPEVKLSETKDSFGNSVLYGKEMAQHDFFLVEINGNIIVEGKPIFEEPSEKQWIFKYPSKYTRPGASINQMHQSMKLGLSLMRTVLETADYIMSMVYRKMVYQPAVTGISTTAEEALTINKGVCQDYAHILITLCRMENIPTRYVVGIMVGEGESHAWVEVYDGEKWYGLDPTNNRHVDNDYIKISHGRDYEDCVVEKGIFYGNGTQAKIVGVKVREND